MWKWRAYPTLKFIAVISVAVLAVASAGSTSFAKKGGEFMICPENEAEILRLRHAEKWPPGTIASQLGLHHSVVERVLEKANQPASNPKRPSIVDPYMPFIEETLKQHPTLKASRIYTMVKERGYPGKPAHFRSIISRCRPIPTREAYLRLKTLPGEQAQVDWAHFGKIAIGNALRVLCAFVMVLSYSRAIFLRFFLGQQLSNFLQGHVEAFENFSGIPRVLLYDNLKSVVLERVGNAIHFNPEFLKFSAYYHFQPRPVAVARGNQKGRAERAIQYVRTSFFPAREWKNLDDLNQQAQKWCWEDAMDRNWPEDPKWTVRSAYLDEESKLLKLPENPFPVEERCVVTAGKTPYVRFDLNDYSVPHEYARKTVTVLADLKSVRILDGNEVIATHERSFDKGQQIENPKHLEALEKAKSEARRHRGINRLSHAAPASEELLKRLADQGLGLTRAVKTLVELLETYGANELEAAIREALEKDAPHAQAVRQILERKRQEEGKPAALPLTLPDDPRVRDLAVEPHSLNSYDQLKEVSNDGNN